MKANAIFPKKVKVLEVYDDWQWNRKVRTVIGERYITGEYFVAEHSKTPGLEEGDAFIIIEKHYNQR